MAFEVFSATKAKSEAEERTSKEALRARSLLSLTSDLLKEKTEAEEAFARAMKNQKEEAETWFEETNARKIDLAKEVAQLETRRQEALAPLLIKEEDIHSVGEELKARELRIKDKEERNEEEARLLMRKLDDLSSREQDIEKKEKHLKVMTLGAENQKQQVAESARLLNQRIAETQNSLNEKEFELSRQQSELDASNNLYKEKEHRLEVREQELESAKRLLEEQRFAKDQSLNEREANLVKQREESTRISKTLSIHEKELKSKEDNFLEREQILSDREASFQELLEKQHNEHKTSLKSLEEENRKLKELQSDLEATQKLQIEKEKGYTKREQDIENANRLLADQRVLLEKGFLELRSKK